MTTLANNPVDRNLSDEAYESVRFLTNGCCEDTGHIGEEELRRLGLKYLPYHSGSFYPLSLVEEEFIAEEYLDLDGEGLLCLMGYSALQNGVKYLVPTIEISFDESVPATMLTWAEAAERNRKAKRIAMHIAQATGGYFMWRDEVAEMYDQTHGRYVTELFIPIEYAQSHATNLATWQTHLKNLAGETPQS